MDTALVNLPAMRVAAVRHRGPYNGVGEAFGTLGAIAGQAGLFAPGATMVALYHDDPDTVPEAELRADAGITVAEEILIPDGLTEHRVPAGRYARRLHVGPYEGLGEAWHQFIDTWLPASAHRMGKGPCIERYLNSPLNTPPEQLRTELYIPVE